MFGIIIIWSVNNLYDRIDPSTNHIDFSLRGKDVGEADLFPAPERKRENTENEDGASSSKKIKLADNEDDSDDNDVMEIENGDVAGFRYSLFTNIPVCFVKASEKASCELK